LFFITFAKRINCRELTLKTGKGRETNIGNKFAATLGVDQNIVFNEKKKKKRNREMTQTEKAVFEINIFFCFSCFS
jgi:hypothetical protein